MTYISGTRGKKLINYCTLIKQIRSGIIKQKFIKKEKDRKILKHKRTKSKQNKTMLPNRNH